jgi:hypothetical protein
MSSVSVNRPWSLQSFVDSLVVELDRARDTLAVKALNRPLSYSVKDLDLDLQIFPQFDGEEVTFVTARPGESGASGLKLQIASITARGIKETSADPMTRDDVSITELDGIDDKAKASLQKLGIKSAKDLERVEERNVDIEKVTDKKLDYRELANVINKARRRQVAPSVSRVNIAHATDGAILSLAGENLAIARSLPEFPIALLDGERVDVLSASERNVELRIDPRRLLGGPRRLEIALDPFAVLTMDLTA